MLTDEQTTELRGMVGDFDAPSVITYVESILAQARAEEREAQTWRSMESAPKDGTTILLGNQHGSWIAKWMEYYQSGYRPSNPWSSLMLNHDYMPTKYAPPTHWMPLPLPPTECK